MKTIISTLRRTVPALFAALTLTILFGAQTARAQVQFASVSPILDCVERERDGSGAETGNYIAYFGYTSPISSPIILRAGGPNNFFFVSPSGDEPPGENSISTFYLGVHPRVVSVKAPIGSEIYWELGVGSARAIFRPYLYCGTDGANSRLTTYQGKLSDGAQAANGTYDLQFQLFNALTGGTARTGLIALDNVPVTNGVFTVQLDLGANALLDGSPAGNLKLNPAILDAENTFFEIGVRAGTSTGAYTVLTPRQPLTAVPLAMRANTANVAFHAVTADKLDGFTPADFIKNTAPPQSSATFSVGNGNVSGDLTVGGTINGTVTNATNAANATNATNAAQLGGVAANQYLTTTSANSNFIQNTTTQQTNSNFNVSGSGAIGGNLTVGGTVSSGCRAGFTAVANGRLCVSETQPADTFWNAAQTCTNLGARVGNSADAVLSFTLSGFNYFAATNPSSEPISKGWLADIINDNVRATWNVNSPTQDFDGTPLNVNTGGTGGAAPQLLYRCVY